MRTNLSKAKQAAGIMLVDTLVFIGVFSIILVLALLGFNRFEQQSRRLRGAADDIGSALVAGERWREDIRQATGPINYNGERGELHIPQKTSVVIYRYANNQLARKNAGEFVPVLKNVQASTMQKTPRKHVTAWRWELEMKTRGKNAKIKPLFHFEAVAPKSS